MDLTDLKSLRAMVKVQVPTTCTVARLMLKVYVLVLAILLGETHPVVTDLATFVTWFTNKESFCISHLHVADCLVETVQLVSHVQLQACTWFLDIESCTTGAAVASVTASNFIQVWHLTGVVDTSWLPTMPLTYHSPKSVPGGPMLGGDNKDKKTTQVRNVITTHHGATELTIRIAHNNNAAVVWNCKGSTSTSGPSCPSSATAILAYPASSPHSSAQFFTWPPRSSCR